MTSIITKMRNVDFSRAMFDPWPVVMGWVATAVLAAVVPWAHWNRKRQMYYKYAGYLVDYQNKQQEYNEANGEQNQYYGANNNCSWWNWSCKNGNGNGNNNNYNQYQNANNNNNQNQNNNNLPNWFSMLGGTTEEQRRQNEEEGGSSNPGAVRFIHAWTNLLFAGLVIYGAVALARGNNLNSARTAFFIFMQFAIMIMILIPQGAIQTDDKEMENSLYGWYGQLGVLMVYQGFWYALYAAGACCFLTARMVFIQRQAKATPATSTTYKTMEEETDIA